MRSRLQGDDEIHFHERLGCEEGGDADQRACGWFAAPVTKRTDDVEE